MDLKKIRLWSYKRQWLGKSGEDTEQVLRDVIAVYSSHPSGPLSLFARLKDFDPEVFRDLDRKKKAFRLAVMRESVHMIPAETARLLRAATLPPGDSEHWAKRYAHRGRLIPPELYPQWKAAIIEALDNPLDGKTIKAMGLTPDDALKPVLNRIAFEEGLLRIGSENLRSNIISYVAIRSWAQEQFLRAEPEEALAWLAGEYFRAFGPARIKDFQWWAGITLGKAKTAAAKLDTVDLGTGMLLRKEDQEEFEAFVPEERGIVDLLPQWDCYTMGYAPDGRGRFIDAERLGRLYGKLGATGGNALGAMLYDGEVRGVWTSRFKGKNMEVKMDWISQLPGHVRAKVGAGFQAIAEMMNAKQAVIADL